MAEKTIPFNQLAKAAYNRGIKRAKVNKIKNDFHEDMVQPAIVSFRDGRYYIVDHQHQSQAIYELNNCDPNTPILCKVLTGLTYEQEADLYYRLNTGSTPLSFKEKLVGRIEAKNPEALEFRDTVESCGYVIDGNTTSSLGAVSTAWKMFRKDGGKRLSQVLSLTYACWPANKNGVDSRIIEGLSLFLQYHGDEYSAERFVKVFSELDPRDLIGKARSYFKQMDSKAFTGPYCMYTIIANCYNARLRNRLAIAAPGVGA